jgi:hypothetical protein
LRRQVLNPFENAIECARFPLAAIPIWPFEVFWCATTIALSRTLPILENGADE